MGHEHNPGQRADRDRQFDAALEPFISNIQRDGEIYPGATRDFVLLHRIDTLPPQERRRADY